MQEHRGKLDSTPMDTLRNRPSTDGADGSGPSDLGDGWISAGRTIVVDREPAGRAGSATPTAAGARFRLARVGPFSVLKHALIFSTGTMVVVLSGLAVLYFVLQAVGVLGSIQHLVNSAGIGHHFRFDPSWIFTRLVWVGLLLVVVGSLVATCLAVFYNAASEVAGGLDLSLESVDRTARADRPTRPVRSDGRRPRNRAGAWRPISVGFGRALSPRNESNGKDAA